ncbi:beta-1,4 N-acetylgalactosaminyltransferase 2 [Ambystoma mexicanum]|uniref:beta-1,4 N-acetylgalactosaminyltransferase 2 n=1 Tax=Ambystoma mexicanum TaxID=8296 RepID=UPI0037E802F7
MKLKVAALALVMALSFVIFIGQKIMVLRGITDYQRPLQKPHQKFAAVSLAPPLQLLPPERYLENFTYSGIRMFGTKPCECENQKGLHVLRFPDAFRPDELDSVKQRRKKEFEHFKMRYKTLPRDVLISQANSPLAYPLYGLEVLPLATLLLPGLGVYLQGGELSQVTLTASLGTFTTLADVSEQVLQGRGEKTMTITSPHVEWVNFILQHTTYTSTVYNIHAVDTVAFVMGPYTAKFPIVIRQPSIPWLYDPGPAQNINSLVTITTKTFLRYEKLNILIKSIHKYYPSITIIVADDNDEPEKIQEPHVEQYFMPFAKGWFAGRNLAVSQVTTKYFLWVDDDFVFTEKTNLEQLVRVLESTHLDMVGGNVDGNLFSFRLLYEEGNEEGDCIHWRGGSYGPIEGFPNCVLTSAVVNFFLAHTARVQSVGFDPKLARVAHTEFFIDGLGSLLVGSCRDVTIDHQRKDQAQDPARADKMAKYNSYRSNTQDQVTFKLQLHYFKNRLKCYTKR